MKKYDINWKLKFIGNIDIVIVDKVVNKISAICDGVEREDEHLSWVYSIGRSLDICIPIILSDLDDYKIEIYRDNYNNEFVIKVKM